MRLFIFFLIFLFCPFQVYSDSSNLESRVRKLVLDNGLTALLVKREGAPVFSAYIRVKVGNIEEPKEATGLAHFFEHMAFKGTTTIGVHNHQAEIRLLEKIHQVGGEIVRKQKEGVSPEELEPLRDSLQSLEEEAKKGLVKNEFTSIYMRNGGNDMNATTSNDYTSYFVSLPSSRLELWAYMESERLIHPVFREFYSEKDVVFEERRMRNDNDPDGRLYEAFMKKAFDESPFRNPVIGLPEDIVNYDFETARSFYESYYVPSRMVLSIVGNFDLDEAERLVRLYFGKLSPKKSKETEVPPENLKGYPREVTLTGGDEPRFHVAFHRPRYPHPDDETLDMIEKIMCDGRTSRLYQLLVLDKKMASEVACDASVPGSRLDALFDFYAIPLSPYTNKQVYQEILQLLEKMKREKVAANELEKVKNRVKADLLWTLKSNMGLASLLTYFESLAGDWKYIYTLQEKLDQITPADIQRVFKTYFVPQRRVSAFLEKK